MVKVRSYYCCLSAVVVGQAGTQAPRRLSTTRPDERILRMSGSGTQSRVRKAQISRGHAGICLLTVG